MKLKMTITGIEITIEGDAEKVKAVPTLLAELPTHLQLLNYIDECLRDRAEDETWTGTTSELARLLTERWPSTMGLILRNHSLDRLMAKLAVEEPDRVGTSRKRDGRRWVIRRAA